MISIHLHGLLEHAAFALLVLAILAAPVIAYVTGRRDGRTDADYEWRELLEYGGLDDELDDAP